MGHPTVETLVSFQFKRAGQKYHGPLGYLNCRIELFQSNLGLLAGHAIGTAFVDLRLRRLTKGKRIRAARLDSNGIATEEQVLIRRIEINPPNSRAWVYDHTVGVKALTLAHADGGSGCTPQVLNHFVWDIHREESATYEVTKLAAC